MKVVLDANCFIDAVTTSSHAFPCLERVFFAAKSGRVTLAVSRHTLAEVLYPPSACELAKTVEVLPYWPIGTISQQAAETGQLAGTWEHAKRNDQIQQELEQLAKAGNDIRDRGAFLDALQAGADAFVTSDRQLVGSGPAERIRAKFGLRVLTPCDLVSEVSL
jgi:predicted nucleic acid-binding protein